MKFDLDAAIDAAQELLPWELTLTVGGVDYPTRRPTVADVGRLLAMKTLPADEVRARVADLFEQPRPDVSAWTADQLGAALAAYLAYYNSQVPKKATAVAEGLAAAMAGERAGT